MQPEIITEEHCVDADSYSSSEKPIHIGAIFILLASSAIGIGLPLCFKYRGNQQTLPELTKIGKHVGTGVILALAFIHLLPPAIESLSSECLPECWQNYPFAPLFALVAALVMPLVEKAIHSCLDHHHAPNSGAGVHDSAESPEEALDSSHSQNNQSNQPAHHNHNSNSTSSSSDLIHSGNTNNGRHYGTTDSHPEQHRIGVNSEVTDARRPLLNDKRVTTYLLEMACFVHSVIIGVTLGVEGGTTFKSLLIALCVHQFFEGFALGTRLSELDTRPESESKKEELCHEIILAVIYAISAPIGAAIGVGIASLYKPHSVTALLTQGVFDSISAGILFYMSFVMAVDFQEDSKQVSRSKKCALYSAVCIGAAGMAVIGIWV